MGEPRSVSVLVVDDDVDIREVLSEILVDAGYSVASAGDGVEALALLGQLRPCLILLDLNMPVMNGRQFRAKQRTDPALSTIPTVIMSAVDRMSTLLGELAPDDALPKPVRFLELMALVRRYCGEATDTAGAAR